MKVTSPKPGMEREEAGRRASAPPQPWLTARASAAAAARQHLSENRVPASKGSAPSPLAAPPSWKGAQQPPPRGAPAPPGSRFALTGHRTAQKGPTVWPTRPRVPRPDTAGPPPGASRTPTRSARVSAAAGALPGSGTLQTRPPRPVGNNRASSAALVVGCAWDPPTSQAATLTGARGGAGRAGAGRGGRAGPGRALPPRPREEPEVRAPSSRWLRSRHPWTHSPLGVSGSPLPSRHHPNSSGFGRQKRTES